MECKNHVEIEREKESKKGIWVGREFEREREREQNRKKIAQWLIQSVNVKR